MRLLPAILVAVTATLAVACSSNDPSPEATACSASGVDQTFIPGDAPGPANGGGAVLVARQMPMGQTILPSSTIFAGADVYLKTINPGTGSDKLTLNLREGSIQGTVVASATVEVADGFSSLVHIPLAKPARTVPGTLYTLELQATRPTHAWTQA